jgi:magnesium transporter
VTDVLLVDYARSHPAEFAALLSRHPLEEGVKVLRALPEADALSVLAVLPGSRLRRVLDAVGDDEVAALVAEAPFELAVALLLRLRPARRKAILGHQRDRRRRLDLERRLAWGAGSLGAIASRNFVTVSSGATLEDLVDELRTHEIALGDEPELFVLDDGGRLRGAVDLRRALEARDRSVAVLRCLVRHQSLPADMPAAVAVDLPLWRRYGVVPVVDREERLVGTLTLAAARDAARAPSTAQGSLSILVGLSVSFLETLASLVGLLFGSGSESARRRETGP